mgnify:CR=1 FL=1
MSETVHSVVNPEQRPVRAQIARILRAGVAWCYTFGCAFAAFLFVLIAQPVRGWLLLLHPWAWGTLRIVGINVDLKGREHLQGPAVFACNHQSLLDVILIPGLAPPKVRFVAKKELVKIPFWGWMLATAGGVLVDRKNSRNAIEAVRKGVRSLPPGWSVAVFPEGTRSFSGELQPFKKGVVHIAKSAGLPVVPLGLDGAQEILPKGYRLPRPGTLYVTVGEPIDTTKWSAEAVEEPLQEVWEAVSECLQASRRRRRSAALSAGQARGDHGAQQASGAAEAAADSGHSVDAVAD